MTENTGRMDVGEGVLWRNKVDRGHISEVEQLYDRAINDAAIPLLTTPRPGLVTDIPPAERTSREVLAYAANSYCDAGKREKTSTNNSSPFRRW